MARRFPQFSGGQPEETEDDIPTDEDIEGLFNGEGMPSKFAGRGDTEGVVSDAFRQARDTAFGRQPGDVYYEKDGMAADIPWSETPEGKAFAAGDVMPPDPNAVASPQRMPGGIPRPTFPTPKMEGGQPEAIGTPPMTPQRMPGPGRPGVPMEAGEGDEPEAIPDAEGLDLSQLMPELGKTQRRPQPQIKEDVLGDLATMRPQDQGPPTDEEIEVPRLDHEGRVMDKDEREDLLLRWREDREEESGRYARPDDIPPRLWKLFTDEEKSALSGRVYRNRREGTVGPPIGPWRSSDSEDPVNYRFGAGTQ